MTDWCCLMEEFSESSPIACAAALRTCFRDYAPAATLVLPLPVAALVGGSWVVGSVWQGTTRPSASNVGGCCPESMASRTFPCARSCWMLQVRPIATDVGDS